MIERLFSYFGKEPQSPPSEIDESIENLIQRQLKDYQHPHSFHSYLNKFLSLFAESGDLEKALRTHLFKKGDLNVEAEKLFHNFLTFIRHQPQDIHSHALILELLMRTKHYGLTKHLTDKKISIEETEKEFMGSFYYMATLILPDPELKEWAFPSQSTQNDGPVIPLPKLKNLQVFCKKNPDYQNLKCVERVLKAKNRAEFLNKVTLDQVLHWNLHYLDRYVSDVLKFPNVIVFFDRFLSDPYIENISSSSWKNRFMLFDQFMTQLGRSGTGDLELSEFLLRFSPVEHIDELFLLQNAYDTFPHSKQQYALAKFRSAVKDELPARAALRNYNNQRFPGYEKREQEKTYCRVENLSSDQEPTTHLVVYSGYEIEFGDYPKKMAGLEWAYDLADDLGFSKDEHEDASGGETSPGPFHFPEIAVITFNRWRDAGLIDFAEKRKQTLHLTYEVEFKEMLAPLVRLAMLAGKIFQPKNFSEKESHTLDIRQKEKLHGKYLEARDFFVVTPEGFETEYPKMVYLASALKQFERLIKFRSRVTKPLHLNWQDHLNPPTIDEIKIMNFSVDEVKMCNIWIKTMKKLIDAMNQIDAKTFPFFQSDGNTTRRLIRNTQAVYPTELSRYDVDPTVVLTNEIIEIDGMRFTNVVAFAQYLIDRSSKQVKHVIDTARSEAVTMIPTISSPKYSGYKAREFFNRFPCNGKTGRQSTTSETELVTRFVNLKEWQKVYQEDMRNIA